MIDWISGANGGIGFLTAVAIAASSSDYHVIVASRSLEKGERALKEMQQQNLKGSLSLLQLDVTNEQSISNAAKAVANDIGRLDILINNAGIVSRSTSLIAQLRETFETNTFGPAIVTEAFISLLQKSTNGRLIYVSSGLGSLACRADESDPYYQLPATAYRMSKAALDMLTICHHAEYAKTGIKVFAFDPGYVVTNLTGEEDRQNRVRNGAGDAAVSAETLLSIIDGRRDSDVGRFVHKDGLHPW